MKNKKVLIGIVTTVIVVVAAYFGWKTFIYRPNITLTFQDQKSFEYGENITDKMLIKDSSGEVTCQKGIDTFQVGNQTLTYLVEQEGFTEEFQHEVEVVDSQSPVIKLKKDKITIEYKGKVDIIKNIDSVSDPVDGKLEYKKKSDVKETDIHYYTYTSELNNGKAGTYKVFIHAVDKNGNKAEKAFQVIVKPEEKKVEEEINTSVTNQTIPQDKVTQVPPASKNGKIICIDAGHQGKGNSAKEAVGPGSSTKKAKVAGGATGVVTKIKESQTNLNVALQLRTELQNRGYTVIMTRTSQNVNISNQQRATKGNSASAVIHLHCDGGASSVRGAHTIAIAKNNPYCPQIYKESSSFASKVINAYCQATGIKSRGVSYRNDLTGLNWSQVPSIYLEMGFISNQEEDKLLNDASFQKKMVQGIANGIDQYFH